MVAIDNRRYISLVLLPTVVASGKDDWKSFLQYLTTAAISTLILSSFFLPALDIAAFGWYNIPIPDERTILCTEKN